MLYDVLDVCRYVIYYSEKKDYGISNLKLQKILYFVQAYFMLENKDHAPCFYEKIEAWDFGPVVPEAYKVYARFGGCDLHVAESDIDIDEDDHRNFHGLRYYDIIDNSDKELINRVIDRFADYTATDLVSLTLCQRPWMDAYNPYQINEITTNAIRRYFSAAK